MESVNQVRSDTISGVDRNVSSWWVSLTGSTLTFSFTGLVIASMIYSLPFVVQPIQNAFESIGTGFEETAATLGASRLDTFFTITVPMAARGFLTALVMGFAHTLGEFGVVLMVGGNIPGETRVLSVAIFSYVERGLWSDAHILAVGMVIFAFVTITVTMLIDRRIGQAVRA